MKNTRVNSPIAWINNRNSHDIYLKPIGYNSRLGLRLVDFYNVSNFITKLTNDFLLIIIIRMLKLLIVIVEVII